MKKNTYPLLLVGFVITVSFLSFFYGIATFKFKIFPYKIVRNAYQTAEYVIQYKIKRPWYYRKLDSGTITNHNLSKSAYNGLNLATSIDSDEQLSVKVVGMTGLKMHEWHVDWFDIWPDPKHLPDKDKPKSRPGTHIHGTVLMPDGDLIFNYEHLGLVKLDICSNVVWRLPYRTHHSIYLNEDESMWVSGQKNHEQSIDKFTNYKPEFIEPMILLVSQDGEVLEEISVFDLLQENGLNGLLYMSSINNRSTEVSGDTLHINDIEPFPKHLKAGIFKQRDLMVSLRNINTIFVFSLNSRKIKFISTGRFVRQHDPDFIDGDTISIFDNNNVSPESSGYQSRIMILSAENNESFVYYTGKKGQVFYTDIMGKHQWLPNGNLLITESRKGRAFEVDRRGEIVWEYFNYVDEGMVGLLEEVYRLPSDYQSLFSQSALHKCKRSSLR